MKIQVQQEEGFLQVNIQGRIDVTNATEFEQKLIPLLSQNMHLVISLESLEYLSSAGLRVFLLAAKKAKEVSGKLSLYGMQPFIQELFQMTGFLALFNVYDNRAKFLETL